MSCFLVLICSRAAGRSSFCHRFMTPVPGFLNRICSVHTQPPRTKFGSRTSYNRSLQRDLSPAGLARSPPPPPSPLGDGSFIGCRPCSLLLLPLPSPLFLPYSFHKFAHVPIKPRALSSLPRIPMPRKHEKPLPPELLRQLPRALTQSFFYDE